MASATNRKTPPDLRNIYDSILDLLIRIKPCLDDTNLPNRPSLIQDLHQVATLAEAFSEQKPRSNKAWAEFADSLDQEGVSLWNTSSLISKTVDDDSPTLVAALRLAGFRLVEAGLDSKPGIEALCHVLQMASKTGAILSEIGRKDAAGSVLTSAAKFEESLRNAADPNSPAIASVTVHYLMSRMEASWKESNYTMAEFMSRKILGDERRLALITRQLKELLVNKFLQIGRSILKGPLPQEGRKIEDAIMWLQRAVTVFDQLDAAAFGISELKVGVLRTLAMAYFQSGSYDRAEAALEELLPAIGSKSDQEGSEYQELRWLRLHILKRRKAAEPVILDAFKCIIDHMDLSETNVADVLQDLRTLSHQRALVIAVNQYYLEKALRMSGPDTACINDLVLSLIFQAAKDDDHTRAIKVLDTGFAAVCQAHVELASVPATACLTLLWQYGERHFNAKRYSEAADWFMLGSHQLFKPSCPTSTAKCYRKAALCYIEQLEFARAATVMRRCTSDDAPTHYIMFLIAVHQGLEAEAIKELHNMRAAPGFDRKMLLLATQISHQLELKGVLLSVLEELLATLMTGRGSADQTVVEAMTLIRCIIRLVLKLASDPKTNQRVLVDIVVKHFRSARALTKTACEQKVFALINKDISWLWRTAYNYAVQGCSEWKHCEDQISELFAITKSLLEACCEASPVDLDAEAYAHLINASFSSVSGQAFLAREASENELLKDDQLRRVTVEINSCKKGIIDILNQRKVQDEADITRAQYFIHTLRVFEAEFLARLKQWDALETIVGETVTSGPLAIGTYEAIADILWADKECPINVLYGSLEAILRASLDHGSLSVERFSRWLRAICTILLARNAAADRLKAIGYIEQAATVMESSIDSEEPYPTDERHWLLGTAYNTGVECLHASSLDEANRWFEVATVICKFTPEGEERATKISEAYTHLLSRYGKTST
ncbi:hypothetical protein APHAL10511_002944 [Amanita phalloides]|nr:hypothetical protein APHAL10511_002944 [Amanita phalloides]